MSTTADQPEDHRSGSRSVRLAWRYGPFAVVGLLALVAVAVFGGDGENDGDRGQSAEAVETDHEELVRSGPMTPEKAELLGEDVDFGSGCDLETKRIKLPTVYAPPCVVPFDDDNGGSTSRGVTDEKIKIVLYVPKADFLISALADAEIQLDPEPTIETLQRYIDLYGRVFETYGREVELETYTGQGAADDVAVAKADAIAIAEMEPFAVVGGPFQAFDVFADELAARGVVCLQGCALAGLPASFVEERAPYVWMDGMTAAQGGRIAAEAIGALAAPGPAELAGDAELREQERVYGALYTEGEGGAEMFEALREGLAAHDIEIGTRIEYALNLNQAQENARNHIVKLKDAGVTTVIVTGDPLTPKFLTEEATAQNYHPEWILGPNYFADTAALTRGTDQDQWVNGFGLGFNTTAHTSAGQASGVYEWAYGTEPTIATAMPYVEPAVRTLFTGIHLAGPELTPQSFRDGLFRYPPSGDAVTSSKVSWGDHGIWPDIDYGASDDVAIIWWDRDAQDEDSIPGIGLYRLANGGQRYTLGGFPKSPDEAGLFDDDSSVFMYSQPLPSAVEELFDDYPPPDPPE